MALTSEQHKVRSTGIGASEAYIACGFESFGKTPTRLWAEKTGKLEREEPPEQAMERINVGNKIEDVIAQLYCEKTGYEVQRSNRDHRAAPVGEPLHFMRTYVDRIVVKQPVVLECKNVDALQHYRGDWGEPGTDQIPLPYLFQSHHILMCTGRERVDVAALVGGNTLHVYHVEPDEELWKMIRRQETAFWECVTTGTPPEMLSPEDIALRYPTQDNELPPKIADLEHFRILERFKFHKQQRAKHNKEAEQYAFELKQYMANSGVLLDMHGMELATFKQNKPSYVTDYEAAFNHLLAIVNGSDGKPYNEDRILKMFTEKKEGNRPLLTKSGEKAWTG